MDFKSNISTTREQSRRLLALGLKPETADMHYTSIPTLKADTLQVSANIYLDLGSPENGETPSWSLSRLLEMMPEYIDKQEQIILMIEPPFICYYDTEFKGQHHFTTQIDIFDNCVDMISWLIHNGYFNQGYLIHSNSSKTGKEDDK